MTLVRLLTTLSDAVLAAIVAVLGGDDEGVTA
jgi:hypothetical protein